MGELNVTGVPGDGSGYLPTGAATPAAAPGDGPEPEYVEMDETRFGDDMGLESSRAAADDPSLKSTRPASELDEP